MKKLLALCLTAVLCLCCLASCGSAHKENKWFSEEKLTKCLVADLPSIEKDYVNSGGEDIYAEDFQGNVALVVGGEDSGVKRLNKEKCDKILSLPLQGKVNSLNASVALGIASYEVLRKRL